MTILRWKRQHHWISDNRFCLNEFFESSFKQVQHSIQNVLRPNSRRTDLFTITSSHLSSAMWHNKEFPLTNFESKWKILFDDMLSFIILLLNCPVKSPIFDSFNMSHIGFVIIHDYMRIMPDETPDGKWDCEEPSIKFLIIKIKQTILAVWFCLSLTECKYL